jgi:hypothetical protein
MLTVQCGLMDKKCNKLPLSWLQNHFLHCKKGYRFYRPGCHWLHGLVWENRYTFCTVWALHVMLACNWFKKITCKTAFWNILKISLTNIKVASPATNEIFHSPEPDVKKHLWIHIPYVILKGVDVYSNNRSFVKLLYCTVLYITFI